MENYKQNKEENNRAHIKNKNIGKTIFILLEQKYKRLSTTSNEQTNLYNSQNTH
jgi:hypothetical protein